MTSLNDVIREATSEHEVFFLLTSYVEAVRHGDLLSVLPGPVRELPLNGLDDVRTRVDGLRAELGSSPRNRQTRVIVEESTEIFCEALNRLQCLEWEKRRAVVMAA
jgi:hypothetical protein